MPKLDTKLANANTGEDKSLLFSPIYAMKKSAFLLRMVVFSLTLAVLLVTCCQNSLAQNRTRDNRSKLAQRGDLTLRELPLNEALYTISNIWDVNIVLGGQLSGTVNGNFKNAPLNEILDSILLANGYSYRPVGESLVIVPLADLGGTNPLFQSTTISLQHAKMDEVIQAVQAFRSPKGSITPIASANSIVVVDYPPQLELIQRIVKDLEANASRISAPAEAPMVDPIDIMNYRPEYIDAESLNEAIQTLVSAEGRASVVAEENQIVVIDKKSNLNLIHKMLTELDTPRAQVRITALIYDINIDDEERMGVNWSHALKGNELDADGNPLDVWSMASKLSGAATAAPSGLMTFQTLNSNFDLTAVIDFLRETDDSRLLADPNVVVIDREEASIQITTEIPFQQLTQTSAGGDIGTTAFRDAGVSLRVKPRIAIDGTILLDVTPSFSTLTGYTDGVNPQPIINRRETSTVVRVSDGQVLVIGGLRQRVDIQTEDGIPYLKDIKYIGRAFRYRRTDVRESELVVFIKTEIIGTTNDNNCRQDDVYIDGMKKLDQVPYASEFPWPKMSPPAPGVRETQWGSDPRPLESGGYPNSYPGYEEVPPAIITPQPVPHSSINPDQNPPQIIKQPIPPQNKVSDIHRLPQIFKSTPQLKPKRQPEALEPRPVTVARPPAKSIQQPVPAASKLILEAESKDRILTTDRSSTQPASRSWLNSVISR